MIGVAILPELPECHLIRQLRSFFTEHRLRTLLIPLLDRSNEVSLRTLDWLCVNYSKHRNIVCSMPDGGLCNIYHAYKVALNVYRRRQFDPFRRRDRATIGIGDETYVTTLGQCNFVFWAWTHGVLQYAHEHREDIERDMNTSSSAHRSELRELRNQGKKRRRSSLSVRSASVCRIYKSPSRVSFVL